MWLSDCTGKSGGGPKWCVVSISSNEASCRRLINTAPMKQSEAWETGRVVYLRFEGTIARPSP